MHNNAFRTLTLIGVLLGLLIIGVFGLIGGDGRTAQASVLSSNAAIARALIYASDDGFFGGLTGTPTQVFGKVMTQQEAMAILTGHQLPANAPLPKDANRKVWLIVFKGRSIEHPNSPAGTGMQSVLYTHTVEMIDAVTGEAIAERMFGPKMVLDIRNLPELAQPQGAEIEVPTQIIRTAVPLATEPAAPKKP